jgi:hypothetical protein
MTQLALFDSLKRQTEIVEFSEPFPKSEQEIHDLQVVEHLKGLSAKQLLEMINEPFNHELGCGGGHPLCPICGANKVDKDGRVCTIRGDLLAECERRGDNLLQELGWPCSEDSPFINKWTGDVDARGHSIQDYGSAEDNWSLMENWLPFKQGLEVEYRLPYLRENAARAQQAFIEHADKYNRDDLKYRKQELFDFYIQHPACVPKLIKFQRRKP